MRPPAEPSRIVRVSINRRLVLENWCTRWLLLVGSIAVGAITTIFTYRYCRGARSDYGILGREDASVPGDWDNPRSHSNSAEAN
jgi:hypothetical protein